MNEQQRELFMVVDMQMTDHYLDEAGEEIVQIGDYYDITKAVIAHLWKQAMRPETIESLGKLHFQNEPEEELAAAGIFHRDWERLKKERHESEADFYRHRASMYAAELLITILGPNPNEQEAE